jgi:death-on-curing protein
VEGIHDRLVGKLWPGADPVFASEPRNKELLESALNSPFQTAFGQDVHPLTLNKGAALFRSLISNHPFHNGNKRTAVIALDHFLMANGYGLVLTNDDMYKLAEKTASYRMREISHEDALAEIVDSISGFVVPYESIQAESRTNPVFVKIYDSLVNIQAHIRNDPSNVII